MPDLSDLVPFHSGQVRNFYLLVLGQVKINLQFCISFEITCCVENSVGPDQLASEASSSGSTLFLIVYVWFHTAFKGVHT